MSAGAVSGQLRSPPSRFLAARALHMFGKDGAMMPFSKSAARRRWSEASSDALSARGHSNCWTWFGDEGGEGGGVTDMRDALPKGRLRLLLLSCPLAGPSMAGRSVPGGWREAEGGAVIMYRAPCLRVWPPIMEVTARPSHVTSVVLAATARG